MSRYWVVARGVDHLDEESRSEVFDKVMEEAMESEWGPTIRRVKETLISEEIIEKALGRIKPD